VVNVIQKSYVQQVQNSYVFFSVLAFEKREWEIKYPEFDYASISRILHYFDLFIDLVLFDSAVTNIITSQYFEVLILSLCLCPNASDGILT
jgi:hypothetical protein